MSGVDRVLGRAAWLFCFLAAVYLTAHMALRWL